MQKQIVIEALRYMRQDMAQVGIPEPVSRSLLIDAADYLDLDSEEKKVVLASIASEENDRRGKMVLALPLLVVWAMPICILIMVKRL